MATFREEAPWNLYKYYDPDTGEFIASPTAFNRSQTNPSLPSQMPSIHTPTIPRPPDDPYAENPPETPTVVSEPKDLKKMTVEERVKHGEYLHFVVRKQE